MKNKYISMLREIKSTCIATVDEYSKPQIRVIDIMLVKGNVLYFCTARGKEFYKELLATEQVAILGMTKEYQTLRVNGKVMHLGCDKEILEEIFTENTAMQHVYPNDSRYILDVFCVKDATIEFFDLSTLPVTKIFDAVGNASVQKKGFIITDNCVSCGECAEVCPQQCIVQKENQYVITQEHCLHCGLCVEQCPIDSIERM